MKTEPKEFSDLIECWQSMPKEGGHAPLKTEFRPSALRRLMPHLFLLELSNKKKIHVRLMGSAVENSLDRTASKDTVFETLLSKDWRFYDRFMKACGGAPCAGRFSRSVERHDGITVQLDSLGVPLADENGTAKYMLGVIVAKSDTDEKLTPLHPEEAVKPSPVHEFIDLGNGIPVKEAGKLVKKSMSPPTVN